MKKLTGSLLFTFSLLAGILYACTSTSMPVPLTSIPSSTSSTIAFKPTTTTTATATSTPSPKSEITIYPGPENISEAKGLSQSKIFSAKINSTKPFVYAANQGWSFFNFAFANTNVKVDITINESIKDWKVRPASSGVIPVKNGNTFSFIFSKPEKIILQINGRDGQKLLISAEPPETDIPNPNDPSVLYYGPGVHYMGYKFTPPASINTIYLAGGAVVRGTLRIENRENIKIVGRGIFAMGEWPHDEQEGLYLHSINGLVVDGITISDSPGWQLSTWNGNNLIVRNVKLLATKTHANTDGIQIGGENYVSVSDFFILANDDGFPIGPGTSIVEIKNGIMWNNTNGASFMLGWGGGGNMHDILYEDIDVLENGSDSSGVFSARWGDINPGLVSGVTYRNIRVENAVRADGSRTKIIDWKIGTSPWNTGSNGQLENISFENVSFPYGGATLQGANAQNGISHIKFINCTIDSIPLTNTAQLGIIQNYTSDISALFGSMVEDVTPSPFPTIAVIDPKKITPLPAGAELLDNPGFEDGIWPWVPYNQAILALTTEVVHSGKYSIKVTRNDQYNGPLQDVWAQLLMQGQGYYTLSAYLRLESGAGFDALYTPVIRISDNMGTKYYGCNANSISDSYWTNISCTQNLTWSGTLNQIVFYIENYVSGDSKAFYVDDLSLKKYP
jgi:hypothetical protein